MYCIMFLQCLLYRPKCVCLSVCLFVCLSLYNSEMGRAIVPKFWGYLQGAPGWYKAHIQKRKKVGVGGHKSAFFVSHGTRWPGATWVGPRLPLRRRRCRPEPERNWRWRPDSTCSSLKWDGRGMGLGLKYAYRQCSSKLGTGQWTGGHIGANVSWESRA